MQRLDDDTAERLITALAEERERAQRETSQSGGNVIGLGFGAGMIFTTGSGSFEAQIEPAERYSQRLRDRAAQLLDAGQMRAFEEMQDEQLVQVRAALRHQGFFNGSTLE